MGHISVFPVKYQISYSKKPWNDSWKLLPAKHAQTSSNFIFASVASNLHRDRIAKQISTQLSTFREASTLFRFPILLHENSPRLSILNSGTLSLSVFNYDPKFPFSQEFCCLLTQFSLPRSDSEICQQFSNFRLWYRKLLANFKSSSIHEKYQFSTQQISLWRQNCARVG